MACRNCGGVVIWRDYEEEDAMADFSRDPKGSFCSGDCKKKFYEDEEKIKYLMENGTSFFRDPASLEILRRIMKKFFEKKTWASGKEFKVIGAEDDFEGAWKKLLLEDLLGEEKKMVKEKSAGRGVQPIGESLPRL